MSDLKHLDLRGLQERRASTVYMIKRYKSYVSGWNERIKWIDIYIRKEKEKR